MNKYLLDANVFIQAKNLHYGFDFCPAFWDWLEQKNASGQVYSIDKVEVELAAGADALSNWIQDKKTLFLPTDAKIFSGLPQVSSWVSSQNYDHSAINTFLQVADFYLVAHALATQATLVTHEVAANSSKKIKIPNVCAGLGISFMTPYQMLRKERARFVLGGV